MISAATNNPVTSTDDVVKKALASYVEKSHRKPATRMPFGVQDMSAAIQKASEKGVTTANPFILNSFDPTGLSESARDILRQAKYKGTATPSFESHSKPKVVKQRKPKGERKVSKPKSKTHQPKKVAKSSSPIKAEVDKNYDRHEHLKNRVPSEEQLSAWVGDSFNRSHSDAELSYWAQRDALLYDAHENNHAGPLVWDKLSDKRANRDSKYDYIPRTAALMNWFEFATPINSVCKPNENHLQFNRVSYVVKHKVLVGGNTLDLGYKRVSLYVPDEYDWEETAKEYSKRTSISKSSRKATQVVVEPVTEVVDTPPWVVEDTNDSVSYNESLHAFDEACKSSKEYTREEHLAYLATQAKYTSFVGPDKLGKVISQPVIAEATSTMEARPKMVVSPDPVPSSNKDKTFTFGQPLLDYICKKYPDGLTPKAMNFLRCTLRSKLYARGEVNMSPAMIVKLINKKVHALAKELFFFAETARLSDINQNENKKVVYKQYMPEGAKVPVMYNTFSKASYEGWWLSRRKDDPRASQQRLMDWLSAKEAAMPSEAYDDSWYWREDAQRYHEACEYNDYVNWWAVQLGDITDNYSTSSSIRVEKLAVPVGEAYFDNPSVGILGIDDTVSPPPLVGEYISKDDGISDCENHTDLNVEMISIPFSGARESLVTKSKNLLASLAITLQVSLITPTGGGTARQH